MRDRLQSRLEILKREFETGQARLRDFEMQQAHLRETLLRISGAIQVLEELLAETNPGDEHEVRAPETQLASSQAMAEST